MLTSIVGLLQRNPRRFSAAVVAALGCVASATFAVVQPPKEAHLPPVRMVLESVQPLAQHAQAALPMQNFRLYRSDQTRSTDTAEVLLRRLDVIDAEAAHFLRTDANAASAILGRVGRSITLETSPNRQLLKLQARWSPLDDGMFQKLTVERTPSGFQSRIETLPMGVSSLMASGTIQTSLFAATDEAQIPDAVAIQLAEIFSNDIDFHRALRKGDRFSVVYEMLEGDGEPLRAGRVLSAEFSTLGKTYQAMWFQEPPRNPAATDATPFALAQAVESSASHSLTKGGYYTLDGENLHRVYLASPLEFSRVSSGFEMRMHPILKTWTAHLGVDYAAPTGTPVRTIGDGVVEFAGVQNGFGNVVMVKHQNNHTTLYAHLSQIQVQAGQTVLQGQYVGLVGATGWATGPHLHFEFRVNGVHQDPLVIARQSQTIPVAAMYKPVFKQVAQQVRLQLAAAALLRLSSVE